jgi:hypothetical protein
MRLIALTALLGGFVASTSVFGQSLTEHAAAAAGATIGTAAGKPLGTALGRVFGEVNNTQAAVAPKTAKPAAAKPAPSAPPAATEHPAAAAKSGGAAGGDVAASGGGGDAGNVPLHHTRHHREPPVEETPVAAPIVPIVAEPVVKEPSTQEVAGIQVGATSSELRETLGAPESTVSIPGDDGHLLEIRQYWAKGEPVGTIRLDNGRVVSVQTQ